MCEFCTKHGDGKIWFKNAANYANDLMADLNRRTYIKDFFNNTIKLELSLSDDSKPFIRKRNPCRIDWFAKWWKKLVRSISDRW